jgi:hypothetical protein
MDLSGFSILHIDGVERVPLKGEYTAESLADAFIENWIPYYECHKCGRCDYCKYAQPHPANPNRSVDIKCGVAVDSLRNFVQASFPVLEKLRGDKIQEYLDGAFYFCKFIYDAEQYIGMCMEAGFREFFAEDAPIIFGRMSHLRENLNSLSASWKKIPEFRSKHPVLFVEGYTEKEFLDEMRKSHWSWFLDLNVEVYGGKGNRRSKRIQMMLNKYNELGYEIYAQGDADGENTDIFRGLINAGSVKKENTFVFRHAFETAIPLSLLYTALKDMEFLGQMPAEQFAAAIGGNNESVVSRLKSALGIQLEEHKLELANTVARILNHPRVV